MKKTEKGTHGLTSNGLVDDLAPASALVLVLVLVLALALVVVLPATT